MRRKRAVSCCAFVVGAALASAALAATEVFTATLSGSNENPANASTATGLAVLTLNTTTHQLGVSVTFSGLSAAATAAHVHCCAVAPANAGVAIPLTAFPAATAGTYTATLDLTLTATYLSTFLTANGGTAAGAEAALVSGIVGAQAYVNVHDSVYPGGEIRGFPLAPDLTVSKTHGGAFLQGQTGAQYTITVSNAGGGPTSGTVTVTDTLPSGLTATAFGGTGWTCDPLPALSCSRSDALGAGLGYDPITLTVNVAPGAAAQLTNNAAVSGGGEADASNDTASDPTVVAPPIPALGRLELVLAGAVLAALAVLALRRMR